MELSTKGRPPCRLGIAFVSPIRNQWPVCFPMWSIPVGKNIDNGKTEVGYEPVGVEMVPPTLNDQTAKVSRSTFASSSTREVEYYNTLSVT